MKAYHEAILSGGGDREESGMCGSSRVECVNGNKWKEPTFEEMYARTVKYVIINVGLL